MLIDMTRLIDEQLTATVKHTVTFDDGRSTAVTPVCYTPQVEGGLHTPVGCGAGQGPGGNPCGFRSGSNRRSTCWIRGGSACSRTIC
jgi:hypothetical protein